MPDRSHLSIGEVLSLLREEFPDVTISKIRFLESQGLVDPERTPSGYRKFYDHDVERLRWILRQQRENFLPLKVIRGRLSEHNGDPADHPAGSAATYAPPREASPVDEPAPTGGDGGERPPSPATVAPSGPSGRAAPPSLFAHLHEVGTSTAGVAASPAAPGASAFEARGAGGTPPAAEPGMGERRSEAPAVENPEPEPETGSWSWSGSGSGSGSGMMRAPASRTAAGEPWGAAPSARPAPVAASGAGVAAEPTADEDDTYTSDELAAAAGCDTNLVSDLQQFGLIAARAVVGGIAYFDGGALAVARCATEFARHGVQARHLRMWRNAADREADLFQQVVLPLLRQRNPQARRQAADALAALAHAGAELRAALVERAVKEIR